MKTKKLSYVIIMIVGLNILMVAAASAESEYEGEIPRIRTDTIETECDKTNDQKENDLPPREDEENLISPPPEEDYDIPDNLVESSGEGDVHILGDMTGDEETLTSDETKENLIAPNQEETDIPDNLVESSGDGDVHILGDMTGDKDAVTTDDAEKNTFIEMGVPAAAVFVVGAIIIALIIIKKKQ